MRQVPVQERPGRHVPRQPVAAFIALDRQKQCPARQRSSRHQPRHQRTREKPLTTRRFGDDRGILVPKVPETDVGRAISLGSAEWLSTLSVAQHRVDTLTPTAGEFGDRRATAARATRQARGNPLATTSWPPSSLAAIDLIRPANSGRGAGRERRRHQGLACGAPEPQNGRPVPPQVGTPAFSRRPVAQELADSCFGLGRGRRRRQALRRPTGR